MRRSAPGRSSSPSTRPANITGFERNADYWREGEPYLDEIVYRVLPDRAAAAGALEADEIQLAAFSAVPLADLDRIGKVDGIEVIDQGLRGADLPARRRDQPSPQGTRRPQGPAGDRPCDRQGFRRQDDLPRLRQAGDRAGAAERQAVLHRRRADLSVRRRQGQRAARRGRLQARQRRHPLQAEAAAGAVLQRDQAVRRLSAPGAGARSASTPRSSTTTRPRTRRQSTPTTLSTSRWRRRCSAAIRRSRPPSSCRAASPTACPSPTRAAMPMPSSTR